MRSGTIRDWLVQHTALEPALLEGDALDRLIDERQRALGVSDRQAYRDMLHHRPDETERLIAGIAVPESWLFRYPRSFDLLATHLVTRLRSTSKVNAAENTSLQMLSIPCAAGQEPCSMAITALHAGWTADRVQIDAVDLDRDLIDTARCGRYYGRAVGKDTPEWARSWVCGTEKEVTVAPQVLATIEYRHGDVLTMDGIGNTTSYDVIFCRNLLIYLNAEARRVLTDRLAAWLAPDGLLFVGHAERLGGLEALFQSVDTPHTFAMKRRPTETAAAPSVEVMTSGVRQLISTPRIQKSMRKGPRPERTAVQAPPKGSPPVRQTTLEEARALADRGHLKDALDAAEWLHAVMGPKVDTLELLGSVHLALGRLEDARDSFRKVVYLEPNHERSLLQLALISDQLQETGQAARYRTRAERAHRRDVTSDERKRDR